MAHTPEDAEPRPVPRVTAVARACTDRRALRLVHAALAVVLGLFVYSPWIDPAVVQIAVFPLLAGTGAVMWQSGRIRRALGRGNRRPAGAPSRGRP
ncbi:hypothetical protein F4561_003809 [Lipingzhangella halophila]|uniref:Uncharacterized protein n=1 Tax=Lipingzhangella halophila TaxID=1783352 RepID=A0A7W7RJ71_9ACTN|nr:hypothetical protein [Lipingzhangella halophila]MBB4932989.1 hypothetical protein [Lipingzhangella halophila]